MATFLDFAKNLLTLTAAVEDLRKQMDAVAKKAAENRERIVRLEAREELLAERISRQASEAVSRMHLQQSDRLTRLEMRIEAPAQGRLPENQG